MSCPFSNLPRIFRFSLSNSFETTSSTSVYHAVSPNRRNPASPAASVTGRTWCGGPIVGLLVRNKTALLKRGASFLQTFGSAPRKSDARSAWHLNASSPPYPGCHSVSGLDVAKLSTIAQVPLYASLCSVRKLDGAYLQNAMTSSEERPSAQIEGSRLPPRENVGGGWGCSGPPTQCSRADSR